MTIVVELSGSLFKYSHLHFQSLGMSKDDAKIIIESREQRYSLIYGRLVHAAIQIPRSSHER